MATPFSTCLAEGQSTIRPPLFNGANYTYWKARMKIFIQAQNYDMWCVIMNGPHTPSILIDGISIPKLEKDWDENDKKLAQLNAKAMNALYCSLDANEFNRISSCISAKEIWDRLEVTHEGTNQVKESKINMLVHKYELFKMEPSESITSMFTRFTDIINGLKSLGKDYTNSDLVRKILRSLPKNWEAKMTAIQEAKDLNKLALEELIGSLMTHELSMNQSSEEEGKKRRSIALKSTARDESSDSADDSKSDEDLASLIQRFKKFMKKKKYEPKKKFFSKGEGSKEKEKEQLPTCYECKRLGHYRPDCPLLRKGSRKFRKKAMVATWSNGESSSSENEEVISDQEENICLMAHGDEVNDANSDDFTFEELHEAFYDLLESYKKLSHKNKELRKQNQLLSNEKFTFDNEKDNLLKEQKVLIEKNKFLQNEIDKLKPFVDKFTLSSDKLKMILENQKAVFDKAGLGYNSFKTQKSLKNLYVKSVYENSSITCFKCNALGHKAYDCNIKKYGNLKKVWVPKGTVHANPIGPKKIWVPKFAK